VSSIVNNADVIIVVASIINNAKTIDFLCTKVVNNESLRHTQAEDPMNDHVELVETSLYFCPLTYIV
jgi:hypothetical protein